MSDKEATTIEQLREAKENLHPTLEYLADSLIEEYEGFGHLSELSIETAQELIERSGV